MENQSLETVIEVDGKKVSIRYWGFETTLDTDLRDELEMSAEERAQEMIREGYVTGELNYMHPDTQEEIRGWWQLQN